MIEDVVDGHNNEKRALTQPPNLDEVSQKQIIYLVAHKHDFTTALHLIDCWQLVGYNVQPLRQIYDTYMLEYKHRLEKFF